MGRGTKHVQPSPKTAYKLSTEERAFCNAMLETEGLDGTAAAKSLGYKQPANAAQRFLKKEKVKAWLGKRLQESEDRADITHDRILATLGYVAFADPRKLVDSEGNLLPLQDLPDEVAFAISEMDIQTVVEEGEDGAPRTRTKAKIKFAPRLQAVELLMKHLRMLANELNVTHGGSVDVIGALLAAAENVSGGDRVITVEQIEAKP